MILHPVKSDKKDLRKIFKSQRADLSAHSVKEKSIKITQNICDFIEAYSFKKIFIFSPIGNEPNILDLAKYFKCALPRMNGKDIIFYPFQNETQLEKNSFNIAEPPITTPIIGNNQTLVCVPALAYDITGYRLGFGGGFYDRFIEKNPSCHYLGIVFHKFIVENLPQDTWDKAVSHICSELGVFKSS